ncbi:MULTISPECIES: SDR family oxidoreductase [unclassified Leeuwenhoekiella]|uniref:SDR family oxidoreductase n=1 Tax=unclassified Leeuwenhoekiella TaxID=2615029 RepID=UPI000C637D49|nr:MULTISPECIES: SDR family NAD(P)-dependent oxidoreductase [unclassified Leeuwenhoekiella]MAW96943.1 short-chain dehydrogenase [Leeuwenhoekiella sp.]MBA80647.1 short-chain dehydrogenase [Leeuwenhoekiella sp.]|tara:strand:+ start:11955 stop:12722 length:768 start_codon:yes stop_codon:yes gene_type:complete
MKARQNTILITGGGSGIGLALAELFMKNDYKVIITGRNLKKLQEVQAVHPELYITPCDVTKDEDVEALVAFTKKQFDGIDILINNAGIMNLFDSGKKGNDLEKQLDEVNVNFKAPMRMLHYFLPQLKTSTNAVLINTSSGLAYVPYCQSPVYSGTKAGLHFWTRSIRPQLARHHIRVVELLPPVVATKLAEEADLTDSRLKPMPPEKLAALFWKDFTSGKEEIAPGISKQLQFFSRLAPRFIFNQLNKQSVPKIL